VQEMLLFKTSFPIVDTCLFGLGDIVLDGDPAPSTPKKAGGPSSLHVSVHVLWPNGWMDQDATWYEGRPGPPLFRPMSIVAKRSTISATAKYLSVRFMDEQPRNLANGSALLE